MTSKEKEAAAPAKTTAHKNKITPDYSNNGPDMSSAKKADRIAKHRKDMPRQFRRVYDIAQTGHSLRAAVNSQCIECMGYQFKEVRLCVSPQCPLFKYRPVQGISYGVSGVVQSSAELTNRG
jgi:hypothetical protein